MSANHPSLVMLALNRGIPTDHPALAIERQIPWTSYLQIDASTASPLAGKNVVFFHVPMGGLIDFPPGIEPTPGARFVSGVKLSIPTAKFQPRMPSAYVFEDLYLARRTLIGAEGIRPMLSAEAVHMGHEDALTRLEMFRTFAKGGRVLGYDKTRVQEILENKRRAALRPYPVAMVEVANYARGIRLAPEVAAQALFALLADEQQERAPGSVLPADRFSALLACCQAAADGSAAFVRVGEFVEEK